MQTGARAAFKAKMLERLAKKPWIADHRESLRTQMLICSAHRTVLCCSDPRVCSGLSTADSWAWISGGAV
jgi:hypothetical protein